MTRQLIKPRTLKGFRDYLPTAMMAREHLIDTVRSVYRVFGYSPIDTPALEYSEILLGKGGDESDKQLFRFEDQGQRDVAMRFDLTIPFARFASQHLHEIGLPFKRYHIGTVWRAEKPQKGRFREFMQCDFDTIGTQSNIADIETVLVIHELLERIGLPSFTIRVNNRLVLNGLLDKLDLTEKSVDILRAIDKLSKIGREKVIQELIELVRTTPEQAQSVVQLTGLSGTPTTILAELDQILSGNEQGQAGVARLRELFDACRTAGIKAERIELDVSIARGLDYYTGTIYETFLGDLPGIGSVCSGGRYDNLAGLFTSQKLPGVGASLGLDRLLVAMEELGLIEKVATPADVLVTVLDADRIGDYLRIAGHLRREGISADVFPEARPLGKQLKYADRKRFRAALIAGEDEFALGGWQVKNLYDGQQSHVSEAGLADHLRGLVTDRQEA